MSLSILKKIQIFCRSFSRIKNWYDLPLVYFRLANKEFITFETKNGLKIKIRVNSTDFMQFVTVWLQEEYSKEDFEIKNNDIVIDVGAHIGLFTLYASQYCDKGIIYSFEPIKENYTVLLSNIEINKLSNIVPCNMAVTSRNGFVKIFLSEDDSGHSITSFTKDSIEVKSKSLNSFLENEIERCNFLKMDCEGAEYDIIESLSKESLNKIEKMCIEYHNAVSDQNILNGLLTKLRNSSYTITIKPSSMDMGIIYAKKI